MRLLEHEGTTSVAAQQFQGGGEAAGPAPMITARRRLESTLFELTRPDSVRCMSKVYCFREKSAVCHARVRRCAIFAYRELIGPELKLVPNPTDYQLGLWLR